MRGVETYKVEEVKLGCTASCTVEIWERKVERRWQGSMTQTCSESHMEARGRVVRW